ncbi:MAG: amidohydrolase [Clostridiales bacterium]|nr:amidohydrolase [Clostridiales bacterium]
MKQTIDKLFKNGTIYTLENEGDTVEALAVAKGKIIFTGTLDDAEKQYEPKEVIDLQGKVLLPSVGDSHLHFYAYCQTLTTVDLAGCTTRKEAFERLKKKADETPKGMWIKGSNFDQSKWKDVEDKLPTNKELDEVTTDHPLVIKRCCLHAVVANTKALEEAKIGNGYVFGPGGLVELNEDGSPNGIFREQASKIFDDIVPDPLLDKEIKATLMSQVLKEASALGITMFHTYAAAIWNFSEDLETYRELDKKGLLPVRMSICLDEMFENPELTAEEKNDPYRKVQYGTFKIFTDGSFGARSAALMEPYSDDPSTTGIMVIEQDELNEVTYQAYVSGLQPATHCIGDRGLEASIQAIEYTLERCKKEGWTDGDIADRLPFRLIHVQLCSADQLARLKKLPVIFDIQPVFLCTDLHWIEQRLGKERMKGAYTWKRYVDEGFICCGSSDCPVESFNPWIGIYAAATRQDLDGTPEGGWYPEELVSIYEAYCMFSKNVPYANGEQDYMGTLEKGKFADMIVIDRDLFKRPANDILNVKVLKTYLAGDEVYSA